MLAQLRTFSKSWLARALLLILVVGFGFWGIKSNLANGGFVPAVATVDGKNITPQQLSRELDLFLRGRNRQGQTMTQPQAIQAGVHRHLLDSMISRMAIRHLADRLGVSASDQQVADAIRAIPSVQGVSGAFSQDAYQSFLREVGYTQPEFEAEMRGDLSSSMLMQAMTAGLRAPASFSALAVAFETEQRTISLAEIPAAQAGDVPHPTQAQIETFYHDNREALRVPEFRALTLVYARASDFAGRVNVSDQRLHDEFERRRASLSQPERRTFVQMSTPDQAKAQDAAQRLARGEDPDAVAQALGLQVVRYANSVQGDVADSAVATNVFALAASAAPTVVHGRLQPWAAVKLISVTPGTTASFESERDRLRSEIANDEAGDLLNEAISAFEEARGGGTPVAEAARANGLPLVQVPAVDAQGRTPDGSPAAAFVDQAALIHTAFQTAEGESSDFQPLAEGTDVLVSVDRITPAAVKPLADVRAQLENAWMGRERARRLTEIGDAVVHEIQGGKTFAQAVRDHHLNLVVSSRAIDRRMAAQLPSRALPGKLFGAREGEAVADLRADGNAAIVGIVEHISRADPAQAPQLAQAAQQQMQQALLQGMSEAIAQEAVASVRIRRNETLLRQAFPSGEGEQEQSQ